MLREYGEDAKLLAGGQSLGPLLNLRMSRPKVLVDLNRVATLVAPPQVRADSVCIPAMTRHRTLETDVAIAKTVPMLSQAMPYVAHRTIRNRGTIGGSLAHADPAAELPSVTVACDAVIVVEAGGFQRRIAAGDFFEGFFSTGLRDGDVLVAIEFPRANGRSGTGWAEFAPRHGDFAVVGVAVRLEFDEQGAVRLARIVCAGVGDRPWRAEEAEALLVGSVPSERILVEVAAVAASAADPGSDTSGSAEYRKHLVELLTLDAAQYAVSNMVES